MLPTVFESPLAAISAERIETAFWVLVVIAFVLFRLMQKHELTAAPLVILPLALAFFGFQELTDLHEEGAVAMLGASIVIEFLLGLLIGRSFVMWRESDGKVWARGTKITLALWALAFILRGVIVAIEDAANLDVTESSEILISLAATFAGQNLILAWRAKWWPRLDIAEPPPDSERL